MRLTASVSSVVTSLQEALTTGLSDISLSAVVDVVVITVLGLLAIRLLLRLLDRLLAGMEPSLAKLVRLGIKMVLVFVLVLILMDYLNIPVTSLIALLSVASLAISLAAQNFLSNVAGGLQLITSQPFQVGDFVETGGCSGTVQEIGLFYTKLTSPDKKLIQLPNSSIVASNIINYSTEPNRRVDWKVNVSYDSPQELVVQTLKELVARTDRVLAEPEPQVRVSNYWPHGVEYTVRVWSKNEDYWDVYFDIVEGCRPAFEQADIRMAHNRISVHLAERPAGQHSDSH